MILHLYGKWAVEFDGRCEISRKLAAFPASGNFVVKKSCNPESEDSARPDRPRQHSFTSISNYTRLFDVWKFASEPHKEYVRTHMTFTNFSLLLNSFLFVTVTLRQPIPTHVYVPPPPQTSYMPAPQRAESLKALARASDHYLLGHHRKGKIARPRD